MSRGHDWPENTLGAAPRDARRFSERTISAFFDARSFARWISGRGMSGRTGATGMSGGGAIGDGGRSHFIRPVFGPLPRTRR